MPYKDPEVRRETSAKYSLAHYYRKKAAKPVGVCSSGTCTKPVDDPRFRTCSACRTYMRQYKKQHRQKKPLDICARTDCTRPATPGKKSCAECRARRRPYEQVTRQSAGQKQWRCMYRQKLKSEVFAAYGGAVCACCRETAMEFLTIDHIKGDGAAHRKALTGNARNGSNLYNWLKKNNYPPGFRVLCLNCNFAYGHFGYCPHAATMTQETGT